MGERGRVKGSLARPLGRHELRWHRSLHGVPNPPEPLCPISPRNCNISISTMPSIHPFQTDDEPGFKMTAASLCQNGCASGERGDGAVALLPSSPGGRCKILSKGGGSLTTKSAPRAGIGIAELSGDGTEWDTDRPTT